MIPSLLPFSTLTHNAMGINASFPLQPNNMRSCELNRGALKDHVLLISLSLGHQKVFFFKGLMFELIVLMPQDVRMHIISNGAIWVTLFCLDYTPKAYSVSTDPTHYTTPTADRGSLLQLNHICFVTVLWVPQIHIVEKTDKLSSYLHASSS